jgi:N-acetylglutamate synthase-like GNAT family acetyltransferase
MPLQENSYSIRIARAKDSAGILSCLAAAFEPYKRYYTAEAYSDTVLSPETIGERLADMNVLVAADTAGNVVGTIAYKIMNDGEGHIRGMAANPGWLGSGTAKNLLDAAEQGLRELKCKRITLDTTKYLQRAIRFYEKNGYRRTENPDDFFGMKLIGFEKTLA